MGIRTQISKWGNSLALRVPKDVAEQAGFSEGTRVDVDIRDDGSVVLRKARPHYTLEELIAGMTLENDHPALIDDAPRGAEFPNGEDD